MLKFQKIFSIQQNEIQTAESGVHIVGRCEGNSVLVSYITDSGNVQTVIAEYNLETHKNTVLFQEEGVHHVCSASQDTSQFLLGFTFRLEEEERGEGYTYVTRIAEVNPMRRTFRLGEPTWELQRLMFLSPEGDTLDTHYIFYIHHKEIIQYKCVLTGDPTCLSVSTQPVPYLLADTFAWAELDIDRSLLYFATLTADSNKTVMVTALRLSYHSEPDLSAEKIFSINFTLPKPYDLIGGDLSYEDRQPTPQVADKCLNLCVRTMDNGSICFCMQFSGLKPGEGGKPEYGVFMLHNGHFLHCQLPPNICDTLPPSKIHFMVCNKLLLAYLPNGFLHVLNCSGEFELYHHIVATGPHCPVWEDGSNCVDVLGEWLLSWGTGTIYSPRFDSEGLMRLFRNTGCSRNQLAIVHISLLFLDDPDLIPDIIKETTYRATQIVAHDIFVEFLLAHAYASIRNSVPVKIQRSLPVTASSSFYHAITYREGSGVLATFVTSRIGGISGNILEMPEGISRLMDRTKNNYYIVRFGRNRFGPKSIVQGYLNGDGSVIKVVETISQTSQAKRRGIMGFFDSFKKSGSGVAPFTPGPMDEGAIAFLRLVANEIQPNLLMSQVQWERLLAYLTPYIIIRDCEEGLESVVSRFVSLQHEASRKLLLGIWAGLELRPEEDPMMTPLMSRRTEKSKLLYHATEKYCLAARELSYPLPRGFNSLSCCLAFRHMTPRQFATHVELKLLQVTDYFYEKIEKEEVEVEDGFYKVLMAFRDN
ncbi:Protein pigeon-like isoform X1 [Oopsacas minuta]|uniref:Protein pigeon-like isoform X1 n=1 Tax=Oopsacas minuta TaxID=111878 RepID=A0AAV7K555_9METZ|nr:Protein pigeon-like isoform X1 [Oopsacas minuta]